MLCPFRYKTGDFMKQGTRYAYKVAKCRCPECLKWHRESMQDYRRRRRAKGGKLVSGKWVTVPDSQLPSLSCFWQCFRFLLPFTQRDQIRRIILMMFSSGYLANMM